MTSFLAQRTDFPSRAAARQLATVVRVIPQGIDFMPWFNAVVARLSVSKVWGYAALGPSAAEPAALAALALAAHGRASASQAALDWLCKQQAADGRVGALDHDSDPAWPTAWAVLAWQVAGNAAANYNAAAARGIAWLLQARGEPLEKTVELGHNPLLIGWPWVLGTHSWLEPTAMAVLALKASGNASHPRTIEAVRLLKDRLLPTGGCNYGNTEVLGQALRPHVQPTGLCLWALAGEPDTDGRIARSLDYLAAEISSQTAAASLSYGLLGLAAHDVLPSDAESWLAAAAARTLARSPAAYRLALLALAAPHADMPLLPCTTHSSPSTSSSLP